MSNNLLQFDNWLRRMLLPVGLEPRGPEDDFLRDVKYWVIGRSPHHHLIEVSEEAVEDGTDLVRAAAQLRTLEWPGEISRHAGKAYLFKSDGSVTERGIE